jgi:4'-phosphopantetheinyl transferase
MPPDRNALPVSMPDVGLDGAFAQRAVVRADAVHVWLIPLDGNREMEDGCRRLDVDELARRDQFAFAKDRRQYIQAHVAVRAVLARYTGCDAGEIRFRRGAHGKPALANRNEPDLRFNLSHCRGLAVLAVAAGRDVGVDVERLDRAGPELLHSTVFWTREERDALARYPERDRPAACLRGWVRKEAVAKAVGIGIGSGLDRFAVSIGENPVLLRMDESLGAGRRFWLADLRLPGHAASLAVEGAAPAVTIVDALQHE